MKQKLINVYEFEELKPDVQEKVIYDFRGQNEYSFLSDDLNYQLMKLLKKYKIKYDDLKLYYSLSYCQGDGLCFIGTFNFKGFSFTINHTGHYYHKNSTEIFIEDYSEDDELTEMISNKVKDSVEQEFKEIYFKICEKLERLGYEMIEYEDSEEHIKEIIEINEYSFRENGEIEN